MLHKHVKEVYDILDKTTEDIEDSIDADFGTLDETLRYIIDTKEGPEERYRQPSVYDLRHVVSHIKAVHGMLLPYHGINPSQGSPPMLEFRKTYAETLRFAKKWVFIVIAIILHDEKQEDPESAPRFTIRHTGEIDNAVDMGMESGDDFSAF